VRPEPLNVLTEDGLLGEEYEEDDCFDGDSNSFKGVGGGPILLDIDLLDRADESPPKEEKRP
jgi:hypothetical protein